MSQRRSGHASEGRHGRAGAERSDFTDANSMAARARSRTGSVSIPGVAQPFGSPPVMSSSPPPPKAELPNLFWGVLGCLSMLVVGFAGLWLAASSGVSLSFLDSIPGRRPPEASDGARITASHQRA